jgi:putative ABC transport system permease protein
MVTTLDRKLLRNLLELRGQVITIALVVASGVASFVSMRSTYASLVYSKNTYYERQRFADVFVHLKRAPDALAARLAELPGVARLDTRVVETVTLPLPDLPEPANGNVVSLPREGKPGLNQIHVTSGRTPERLGEVVLLQTFADAHRLGVGNRLPAVINGRLRELTIVGTALSPEYVFAMAPGDITVDEKRFAVLWMLSDELLPAYQMEGAFNALSLQLQPGVTAGQVLSDLDRELAAYGGLGAQSRDKQQSNFALEGELAQLRSMAGMLPLIFLGVAAFLLNVVLARLVNLQRSQIAALKALGYTDREIALHYLKLVALITLIGAAAGALLGVWGGRAWTQFYGRFFKFPVLSYRLDWQLLMSSTAISLGAAVLGALASARHIARMPPAEAMRPSPPAQYRTTWLERWGFYHWLAPAARMVAREVERRPLRMLVSSVGIAMAVGILVVARFWSDAVDLLIDVQFHRSMREDLSVTFINRQPPRAIRELGHLPGVLRAEGLSVVPVRFRSGYRYRDAALIGYPQETELRRVLDRKGQEVLVPEQGVLLTSTLAAVLGVEVGQAIEVELREGDRQRREVVVAGLVDEMFGLQGHMTWTAQSALLRDQGSYSMALLEIDLSRYEEVQRRLKDIPEVASVTRRDNLRERFEAQSGGMMLVFTLIATLFAATIAIGVVYNNARVALSLRSRDLASLRVLGFTRAEISAILLGELALQVLLAIPLGLFIGTGMAEAMMSGVDPETYRFPVVISVHTYVFAAVVTLCAGLFSALLVRRKLDRLDLIGVLKTRE